MPLFPAHRHRSPGVLRWSEAMLGVLTEAGFDGTRRVIALRGLLSYVIGAIQLEHLGPLSGTGTVAMTQLPRTEFPLMAETAQSARRVGPDEEFGGGFDIVLEGRAA